MILTNKIENDIDNYRKYSICIINVYVDFSTHSGHDGRVSLAGSDGGWKSGLGGKPAVEPVFGVIPAPAKTRTSSDRLPDHPSGRVGRGRVDRDPGGLR